MMAALFAVGIAIGVRMAREHVAFVGRQSACLQWDAPNLRLNHPTLGQLLQALATQHGVPIDVDWAELAKVNVASTTELPDFYVQDVTFDQVMSMVKIATPHIGFYESQGGIIVTSDDAAAATLTLRTYEVSDILQNHRAWEPDNTRDFDGFSTSGTFMPQSMRASSPPDSLIRMIMDCVAPDSWISVGGTVGGLSCVAERLVVMQTPDNQTQVAALLDQLRHATNPDKQHIQRLGRLSFEHDPLNPSLPALQFKSASIRNTANLLSSASGVRISFDWEALVRDAGVDPNSAAPSTLPAAHLNESIKTLLTGDPSNQKVRVVSTGDLLLVSSDSQLGEERPTTRFYPCPDTPQTRAMRSRITAAVAAAAPADTKQPPEYDPPTAVQFWPGWLVVRGNERAQAAVVHLLTAEHP